MMEVKWPPEDEGKVLILDGSVGDRLKDFQSVIELEPSIPYKDAFSNVCYANIIHPDLVYEVHESYVNYCDVITTNSFGCTLKSLGKGNMHVYRDELVRKSCEIAKKAALSATGRIPWVAGSVGPLGECYMSDCPTEVTMEEEYGTLIRLLTAGGVDIILCETMSCIKEAICACRQARKIAPEKMLWVSFTLDDTLSKANHGNCLLRSGESLEVSVKSLINILNASHIGAILVNCCHPNVADVAVRTLSKTLKGTRIRYGAYANGFRCSTTEWIMEEYGKSNIDESRYLVSTQSTSTVFSAQEYADHAEHWVKDGATVVGGCCGVGPDHIRTLHRRLNHRCNE